LTLIDADDLSQSTISVPVLDLIVSLGEKRLYRDVRSSAQDAALTLTVTGNTAPLPPDAIEVRSLYFTNGVALEYMPYEQIQTRLQLQGQTARKPIFYSQQDDTVVFWPMQGDGTVILGRYYRQFGSIVTQGLQGNTFFARWPELWLYAALTEASPYIGEVTRLPIWEQRYQQCANDIRDTERRRRTGGSKLVTRVA
jgi:hypothetical protein